MANQGNLLVKATGPGLLCFVLAVIIVCFALTSKTELEPGAFTIYPGADSFGLPLADTAGVDGVAGSNFAGSSGGNIAALVVEQELQAFEECICPEQVVCEDSDADTTSTAE